MIRPVSFLSAVFLGVLASHAVAADPKTTNPSCTNAFAVLGWSHFDRQQAEAIEKLAASRLKKAAVLEQMGDPCAAVATYEGVLALAARGADADKVSMARQRLAALEPALRSTVTIKTEPANAQDLVVTLDGVRISGARVALAAGTHTITVGANGFQTHTENLSTCKEDRELAVQLQTVGGASPVVASPTPSTVTGSSDKDKDDDEDDDKGDEDHAPPAAPVPAAPSAPAAPSDAAVLAPVESPAAPPPPLVFKGTAAMRRELARLSTAENDWQRIADHWEASKKYPWAKVGWILGRRRQLEQVASIQRGQATHVNFMQYRVKGQEGAYAYVANCGTGATCNSIAKTFLYLYPGVGVPQVECGALPGVLENPFAPEIPIPSAEEIAKRDAEWVASHAPDDDDDDDDKSGKKDKADKKAEDKSDDDDDDDDD